MSDSHTMTLETFAALARQSLDEFVEEHQDADLELHESDWYERLAIFAAGGPRCKISLDGRSKTPA